MWWKEPIDCLIWLIRTLSEAVLIPSECNGYATIYYYQLKQRGGRGVPG